MGMLNYLTEPKDESKSLSIIQHNCYLQIEL
jgi:hypothetical protein